MLPSAAASQRRVLLYIPSPVLSSTIFKNSAVFSAAGAPIASNHRCPNSKTIPQPASSQTVSQSVQLHIPFRASAHMIHHQFLIFRPQLIQHFLIFPLHFQTFRLQISEFIILPGPLQGILKSVVHCTCHNKHLLYFFRTAGDPAVFLPLLSYCNSKEVTFASGNGYYLLKKR